MSARSERARPARVPRDAELERLARAYRTLPADRSRLIVLVGPPGCGAAKLVDRFVSEQRPPVVLRSVGARSRSFGTLSELLRAARATLGDPEREPVDLAAYAERRAGLVEEVRALLGRLDGFHPPVVIIEDLDRSDGPTLSLLEHLLQAPPRNAARGAALLVATTSDARAPALRPLLADEGTEIVRLDPLDEEGVREYLSRPEVVARMLERSGGLPDRIDDLLEGRAGGAGEPTPELSEGARRLLDAVAVVDRPATLERLCRIADQAPRLADVEELTSAGLTMRALRDGVLGLRVRTRAQRDAHYARLSDAHRRELHRRAVEVFREESPEEAARHAAKAGERELALRLALAACEDPASGLAGRDAVELLREVQGGSELPPSTEVAAKLATLYLAAGEAQRALLHARRVREERPEDPDAITTLARALVIAGDLDEAWRELERARGLEGPPELEAEVRLRQADVAYWRGDTDEARRLAREAEGAAADHGWLPIELEAACIRARVELLAGALDEAEAIAAEGRLRAAEAGLARHRCDFVNVLGNVAWHREDLDQANAYFVRAGEIADRSGAVYRWATAVGNVAAVDQLQGRFGRAVDGYGRALRLLEHTGFRNQQARAMNNLASLRGSIGDPRGALELTRRASEIATEAAVALEIALIRGDAHRALGSWEAAEKDYREGLRLAAELGDATREAQARLGLARAASDSGRTALARERLDALGPSLAVRDRARAALLRARLAEGADRVALARRAVMAAEAARHGLTEQAARIVLTGALADAGLTDRAAEQLARIRELEEQIASQLSASDQATFAERPDALRFLALEARLPQAGAGPEPGEASSPAPEDALVGRSAPMRELRSLIARVAPTEALALVIGESGVGKELVADALHASSKRSGAPLVKVNCAALVETLLLSELFGHERGAFTGAHAARKGRFELADGGTLFLDEIGEISPKTQATLLRVLQEGTFERVGGTRTIEVDVRVIAATNRDLAALVKEGRFREDLYYRLAGITVCVPPLRERFDDLGALSAHFLTEIGPEMGRGQVELGRDALAALRRHRWPGNVRELQNVLRSATLASDGRVLGAEDVRPFLSEGRAPSAAPDEPHEQTLPALFYDAIREGGVTLYELRQAMERQAIERALEETGGNITHAAELLGMKRSRVSQLAKKHGLKKEQDR